jgi:hypothetical protein
LEAILPLFPKKMTLLAPVQISINVELLVDFASQLEQIQDTGTGRWSRLFESYFSAPAHDRYFAPGDINVDTLFRKSLLSPKPVHSGFGG